MGHLQLLAQPLWVNLFVLIPPALFFSWRSRGIQIFGRQFLRLGALLLNNLQCVRPAIVGYDDSRVFHEMASPQMGSDYLRSTSPMSVIRLTISPPVGWNQKKNTQSSIHFNVAHPSPSASTGTGTGEA